MTTNNSDDDLPLTDAANSGKHKKQRRRQSKVFTDLNRLRDDDDDDDEHLYTNHQLISFYKNETFTAPSPKQYETLYEGPKRLFSAKGELSIGKSLSKRYIEPYEFWKQKDPKNAKIQHRKRMIAKQFKGRKKPKAPDNKKRSDTDQKLKLLLDNIPQLDSQSDGESSKDSLPREAAQKPTGVECVVEDSGIKPPSVLQEMEHQSDVSNTVEGDSKNAQHANDSMNITSRLDDDVDMAELDGINDQHIKEQFLELLHSEDILFCSSNSSIQNKGQKSQDDRRVSVRRSARFLKDSALTGSVFAEENSPSNSQAASFVDFVSVRSKPEKNKSKRRGHARIVNSPENKENLATLISPAIANDVIQQKKRNKHRRRPAACFSVAACSQNSPVNLAANDQLYQTELRPDDDFSEDVGTCPDDKRMFRDEPSHCKECPDQTSSNLNRLKHQQGHSDSVFKPKESFESQTVAVFADSSKTESVNDTSPKSNQLLPKSQTQILVTPSKSLTSNVKHSENKKYKNIVDALEDSDDEEIISGMIGRQVLMPPRLENRRVHNIAIALTPE